MIRHRTDQIKSFLGAIGRDRRLPDALFRAVAERGLLRLHAAAKQIAVSPNNYIVADRVARSLRTGECADLIVSQRGSLINKLRRCIDDL